MKWVYSFKYLFYHIFLYMADMIPVLEGTHMVSSFHEHLKGQELVHLKSVYKILL